MTSDPVLDLILVLPFGVFLVLFAIRLMVFPTWSVPRLISLSFTFPVSFAYFLVIAPEMVRDGRFRSWSELYRLALMLILAFPQMYVLLLFGFLAVLRRSADSSRLSIAVVVVHVVGQYWTRALGS